ncbi:MAG: hypothetical protein H6625_05760 [Bdellovibrionaceae bacterium]|nr:hypothetical protein [Pseudobdellovibrionaceae bacterium]
MYYEIYIQSKIEVYLRSISYIIFLVLTCSLLSISANAIENLSFLPRKVIYEPGPANPKGFIVAFPGGKGIFYYQWTLDNSKPSKNLLIKYHKYFREDFSLVLVGPRHSEEYLGAENERFDPEWAEDVNKIIKFFNRKNLPVILMGQSTGAMTVAYLMDKVQASLAVMTSPLTIPILSEGYPKKSIPSLLVHHYYDSCPLSPYAGVQELSAKIKDSEILMYYDIKKTVANWWGCTALSLHSYYGFQRQVISDVKRWMIRNIK